MNDIKLALLGDHDAAYRLTENGILLPCPFCGGKAHIETRATSMRGVSRGFVFQVACGKCDFSLGQYEVEFRLSETGDIVPIKDERNAARFAWNTRAAVDLEAMYDDTSD